MAESRGYFSEIMNMGNDNEMDTEEDDEEKARLYKEPMRRNLLTVFDKAMPVEVADERMSVFLRVRPFSDQELEQEENQGCVDVQNNFMVSAHAPKDSHTFKAQQYGLYKARHHFTFSRVFPESTTQKEFFDCTMLKLVQDFIEGQNCLVFTYGVTNSGKTYTIQGNARDAGILPRGLDVLFNSINSRQRPGMDLKPRMFCDVSKLTPEEEEKERKVKESTLKLNSSEDVDVMTLLGDDASDQSVMNTTQQSDRKGSVESGDTLMAELENRDREETAVDVSVQGQIRFTVWVSFAEIYNEQIFDLLEPLPKKKDARRPVLKLSEDRRGSPYIKGLKEIHVTSADEAYKLLTIGQRNLKTACTRLNQCSSRSHCIFNIKIIRVPDKGDPKMARVSMLSLCDLAGSERQSKTHTTGDRVKEAGNINTSLLTLGRCIELLRYNQQHKDKENRIIPFRDSRLTRLFQNFFCGRGKAAMIVNVSQCASMFDETLNVFKFSAIAKQVVMPPKPAEKPIEPKRKRTTKSTRASSICWEASATPSRTSQQSAAVAEEDLLEEEEEEDDDDLYIEHLEECVEKLETKVKELKHERLLREVEIRREVCQEMQQQFVQIEDTYSHLLKETRRQEAEKFGKKLQLIMDYSQPQPSKRPRLDISQPSTSKDVMVDEDDEWVSSLLLHQEKVKVQEREASLAELRGQVTELQFQVADLTRRNKEAADRADQAEQAQRQLEKDCAEKVAQAERLREAAAQDAQKAVEDLGHSVLVETLSQQLQEVKDRLKEKEKEVCELNEMLTDAGETFHQKEEEIAKLKQAIADDEGKAEQQMETIRELRALLEESKTAVEDSERRLEVKNVSLTDMKEELVQLQARLNNKDHHGQASGDANGTSNALKKCQEELAIARSRLKHEEEDFQQREKALIHGYTAEINNLKSQMALLKSRNLGKCVATSPMRAATPDRLGASPSRGRLRKLGAGSWKKGRKRKGGDLEESFRTDVDLLHRLKEIANDLSLSADLRHKLQELQSASEWLQQQAGERGEVEGRLQQTQQELQELQKQFGELSAASSEITRQLDHKKELHAELTDNQSESAELRQKLRIAESAAEDLETRLTAASHQKLAAEASKAEVVQELRDTKALLQQAEAKDSEHLSELGDLQIALQSMTDTNSQLTADCDSYRMMLEAQQAKMVSAAEEQEVSQDTLHRLKQELSQHQREAERAKEKNEELQTMVEELKAMLSQTTGQLETKSAQLKVFEKKAEGCEQSASSNEAMLKTALSEANDSIQDKTQQCESFQAKISEHQAEISRLKTSLQECESREAALLETKAQAESLQAELKGKDSRTESLQAELKNKDSCIASLKTELSAAKESYEQQVQELKDNISKMQSTFDENLSSEKACLQAKEETLRELRTNVAALETGLEDRKKEIAELGTAVETGKSETAEKDRLLAETTCAKEEVSKNCTELKEQVESLLETKQTLEDVHRQLQERLQAAEQRAAEDCGRCRELGSQLQSTEQLLQELRQKESGRLSKLQSLEKAQKEARRVQDRKLAEAQEAAAAKETELGHLKASLTQLTEKTSQAGALQAELSQASMTIADLRSRLHMEQALTLRHKDSLQETSQENQQLEKRLDSVSQELEKTVKEKANLTEEMGGLKARVSQLETANIETRERLEQELSQCKASVEALTVKQQQEAAERRHSLQMSSQKDRVERETLEKKLKEFEMEGEKSRESYQKACVDLDNVKAELDSAKAELDSAKAELDSAKTELDSAKVTIGDLEQCRATLKAQIAAQDGVQPNVEICSAENAELELELEAEKRKNNELQKQIKALSTIDVATDAPGSLRRLRKEKIQAESDVANGRFEVERLQRQVERLLNTKEAKPSVQSPSVKSCLNCLRNRTKQGGSSEESSDETSALRHTLSETSRQLHEEETVRQRVECELLEVKAKLLSSETQLTEVKAAPCDTLTPLGALSGTTSLSATSRLEAHSILQAELEKSQGREANLRKELQACAKMMDSERTTQLEEHLAQKTLELERALQREKERRQLSLLKPDDGRWREELQQQVDTLTSQLEARDQRLQDTKQRLADVQQDLIRAQQQRSIAVEDVKENERVIQRLKDALMEQEETMEKQDTVMTEKDQEMATLTAELEKVSERCSVLRDQESASSRELVSLTRRQVQLQEENKVMAREHTALHSKLNKVSEEKQQLQETVTSLTAENSRLKGTLTDGDRASVSLQDKLTAMEKELSKVKSAYEKDTKIYLTREEERKTLKEKVEALEVEKKHLEDKCKSGDEERQRWREQRDQMVGQLESVLKKQAEENKALRAQLHDDKDYGKLLDEERKEKQELKRQLKVVQRAKDSIMADLRHGNHQLQGQEPPPALPPPQHHSFRVNDSDLVDDVDTAGHLEVDATPPVAAKGLRKGRKRTSALNRSSDSSAGSSKSRRKPRGKQQDASMEVVQEAPESAEKKGVTPRLQDLEERSTNSPLTRSARRLLQLISPERHRNTSSSRKSGTADQENTTPVDTPAADDTSASKRGRRKVKQEEEEAPPRPPPPFDCAPFQPAAMETRKSSRLRERRKGNKEQSIV